MQVQQMHIRVPCQNYASYKGQKIYRNKFVFLRLLTVVVNCRVPRRFPAMRRATKALVAAIFLYCNLTDFSMVIIIK